MLAYETAECPKCHHKVNHDEPTESNPSEWRDCPGGCGLEWFNTVIEDWDLEVYTLWRHKATKQPLNYNHIKR